jgi:acetoin:2,6-dichlorophenolindophenol oxidoreductase subunit alpha
MNSPMAEDIVLNTLSRLTDTDLATLLLIRRFEEALLDLFADGKVSGTTHTCLGQEYIPVALAPLLRGDMAISNHRGHGHYLAHCADPEGLLAEILGRAGAPCCGVGGSQHLHREGYLSTGVQGEGVAVAAGAALHAKREGRSQLAVAYIGDGTWGEGIVYETLNIAQLWSLPLLVVVENNGIAQSTPTARQMAGSIGDRAAAFGIDFQRSGSMDIMDIRADIAPLIERMRALPRPLVLEFDTIRLGPHSKGDDTRSAAEIAALTGRDWCAQYAEAFPAQFAAVDATQRARVTTIFREVQSRPLATWTGSGQ